MPRNGAESVLGTPPDASKMKVLKDGVFGACIHVRQELSPFYGEVQPALCSRLHNTIQGYGADDITRGFVLIQNPQR